MAIDPTASLSGFTPLGNLVQKQQASAAQSSNAPDFSSVLGQLASETASTIKAGEDTAIKGIQGHAPVQDVVQSVMKAETSLQTALALRDKAVAAYQDLIRMSI